MMKVTDVEVFISCHVLYGDMSPNSEYLVTGDVEVHVKVNHVLVNVDTQIRSHVFLIKSDQIYFVLLYVESVIRFVQLWKTQVI